MYNVQCITKIFFKNFIFYNLSFIYYIIIRSCVWRGSKSSLPQTQDFFILNIKYLLFKLAKLSIGFLPIDSSVFFQISYIPIKNCKAIFEQLERFSARRRVFQPKHTKPVCEIGKLKVAAKIFRLPYFLSSTTSASTTLSSPFGTSCCACPALAPVAPCAPACCCCCAAL